MKRMMRASSASLAYAPGVVQFIEGKTAPHCGRGRECNFQTTAPSRGRKGATKVLWQFLAMTLIGALVAIRLAAPLAADTKKLTEDQRIELLRGLMAEYAKIQVLLPQSKKALEVTTEGTWDQAKWQAAQKEFGPAGRVGDIIQVTHVEVEKERIILQLNGGGRSEKKWYDHIQVGMGNTTTPISGNGSNAISGTTIALNFGGPIGEVTSAEVKKMLKPVLDFDKQESVTVDALESLPEPIKQAIKAKKAVEGMTRDQVLMAVGKPFRKTREPKNGEETEDWIYGEPPGRVTFVTFIGDKVTRVKETYAGLGGSISGKNAGKNASAGDPRAEE